MVDFLTVQQAADELRVDPSRVRRLIRDGRLKATRHGARVYMIRRADLDAVRDRPPGRPPKRKD